MVLYAYATNERSARGIERHCRDDVAYRVITANVVPDHATIARFLCRHEQALADLFASVLRLCARAGLVGSGVVAIDGTKVLANANRDQNVDYERIAREILEEAKATDAAEDELYGEKRGDELPEELATPEGRRAWLKRELARGPASTAGSPHSRRSSASAKLAEDARSGHSWGSSPSAIRWRAPHWPRASTAGHAVCRTVSSGCAPAESSLRTPTRTGWRRRRWACSREAYSSRKSGATPIS